MMALICESVNLFMRGGSLPSQGAEAAGGTESRAQAELPSVQPGIEPVSGRVTRLARRHALFGGVLLAAAAVRILAILGYPGVLVTPDSTSYVSVALRMRPYPVRPSGYPAMLWLLRPFHSLAAVISVQHAIGLGTGVLGYLLLRRVGLPGWGATLAMVPVLLSAYEVQLEHFLLADTLFAFLVMLAIVLVMWRPDPPVWLCALAGLVLAAATLVRSQGLALIIVFLACVLIRFAGWRTIAGALAMCAAFAIPVAGYAAWFQSAHGTFRLTSSDGAFLYAAVTPFADCGQIKPPPAERQLCLNVPVTERSYSQTYIWDSDSPLRAIPGGKFGRTAERLGSDFALRAIRAQPAAYLGAVWQSLREGFLLHGNASSPVLLHREAAALQRDFMFPAAPPQPPHPYQARYYNAYGPARTCGWSSPTRPGYGLISGSSWCPDRCSA